MPVSQFLIPRLFLLLCLTTLVSGGHGGHDPDHDHDVPDNNEPSSNTSSDQRSRSLILVKIWCLILVFIGTFVGGVSPYFLKWGEGFLILGTQFAGGVFLGTALMHFLRDANETFGDLTSKEYPFAYMLACSGYLMTMLADCVISYVYRGGGSVRGDVELQGTEQQTVTRSTNETSQSQLEADNTTHAHTKPLLAKASSFGDSILLIVALCFHSVFEGITIGVAETKADAWRALWTVSLHKVFAAIAMGIALLQMIPDRPLLSCMAYAFAFAISSPIGVAIGIVIDATTQGVVADWIYAISMGLAYGVFIYVSINHLLSKGYVSQKPSSVNTPHHKFMGALLGISVIAVVMIWDT